MGLFFSTPIRYDWKPELPDFRDQIFKYTRINSLPNSVDLRDKIVEPKKDYGSSSANTIATILSTYGYSFSFKGSYEDLSSIRHCIKKFKLKAAYGEKTDFPYSKLANYKSQLRKSLVDGFPVAFGLTVFESFESIDQTGVVKQPSEKEKMLGGVCVLIVGYDNTKAHWIAKHTFGKEFGDNGYIYIPYEVLIRTNNLSTDFWRITITT